MFNVQTLATNNVVVAEAIELGHQKEFEKNVQCSNSGY